MSDWELSAAAKASLADYCKTRRRMVRKQNFRAFLAWLRKVLP